jgi:hypothetical protein
MAFQILMMLTAMTLVIVTTDLMMRVPKKMNLCLWTWINIPLRPLPWLHHLFHMHLRWQALPYQLPSWEPHLPATQLCLWYQQLCL